MLIGEGTYSKQVASRVASGIRHLIEHPEDQRFLELPTIKNEHRSGMESPRRVEILFSIRPDFDLDEPVTSLADGGEIIHCRTSEGKRLDIMITASTPGERELMPALIIIEA